MSENIISCRNISITLGQKNILDDVSFDIKEGTITSLLGVSGSGKSTLLRYMAGLIPSDSGTMRLRGHNANNDRDTLIKAADRNIAFMFQDYALFPHKTALENVMMADISNHHNKKDDALKILSEAGLKKVADQYPHQLSGGEKQRVALARSLMQKTDIIFLDEPFSNLDARLRDHLRDDILSLLKEHEKTIIMVTHDPNEAMLVSDHIIYMHDGKIMQSGCAQTLYTSPINIKTASFLGPVNILQGYFTNKGLETEVGCFNVDDLSVKTADICIRYEAFQVTSENKASFCGIITSLSFTGGHYICHMSVGNTVLTAHLPSYDVENKQIGQKLFLKINDEGLFVFPHQE